MDKDQVTRLSEEQQKALKSTEEQIGQWNIFKQDYVALNERLKTLPNEISYDVMVPLCGVALVPGKLVHTNEVRVLLGDNWFVDRSALQASQIVDRRLQKVEESLTELQQQHDLLSSRQRFTQGLTQGGFQELREEYDEEKERQWRKDHRERTKAHKARVRAGGEKDRDVVEDTEDSARIESDEALWRRLKQLELEESRGDELNRLDNEALQDAESLSAARHKEGSSGKESSDEEDLTTQRSTKGGRRVQWREAESSSDSSSGSDVTDDAPRVIRFRHTPAAGERGTTARAVGDEAGDLVPQSPADLIRLVRMPEPKSILKSATNFGAVDRGREERRREIEEDKGRRGKVVLPGPSDAVSSVVVERTPVVDSSQGTSAFEPSQPKRVSKFKARRQVKE